MKQKDFQKFQQQGLVFKNNLRNLLFKDLAQFATKEHRDEKTKSPKTMAAKRPSHLVSINIPNYTGLRKEIIQNCGEKSLQGATESAKTLYFAV